MSNQQQTKMFQNKNLSILTSNLLFKGIDDSVVSPLFNSKNFQAEKEGELIFQAGDESQWLYLILQGEVKLKYFGTKGSNASFRRSKNQFFGEREIIDRTTRISSAVADTDCIFYLINKEEIYQLAGKHKIILKNLSFDYAEEEQIADDIVVGQQSFTVNPDESSSENVEDKIQEEIIIDEEIADIAFNVPANEELYDFHDESHLTFTDEEDENENLDFNNSFYNEEFNTEVPVENNIGNNGSTDQFTSLIENNLGNNSPINQHTGLEENNLGNNGSINQLTGLSEEYLEEQNSLSENDNLIPSINDFENIPAEPEKFAFSNSFDNQQSTNGVEYQTETITLIESAQKFLSNNIRFPLNEIKKFAEYLKKTPNSDEVPYINDLISKQADSVNTIVESTLEFLSGKSNVNLNLLNADNVINDVLSLLSDYIESRNSVLYKKIETRANIKVNKDKLYFALFQVAKNACDAMPEGGNIFVIATKEEGQVKIVIIDEGLGIPSSLTFEVFEPLISHGKTDASGIGLSIAKKIIQDHNGDISVDGELGEGTKILISLPEII